MAGQKWYVRNRGKVSGPFTLEQLLSQKSLGRLTKVHQISEDAKSWQPATSHVELFPPVVPRSRRASARRDALAEPAGSSRSAASHAEPAVPVLMEEASSLGELTSDQPPLRTREGGRVFEAINASFEVRNRVLLEDVSFSITSGSLVALMGPSGAGKSTLMNLLNGYANPSTGIILCCGDDLFRNYNLYRGHIGFVPQDDIIHGDLTVREALRFSARLRMAGRIRAAEIERRVEQVLEDLGLQTVANVLVGSPVRKGISGGQRKRVNLAMELITNPEILILDEPTSGLSSEDALAVIRLLRRLSDDGKTVILSIHQPSVEIFEQFDQLVMVSKDAGTSDPGRIVYSGPAYPESIDFFSSVLSPNSIRAEQRQSPDLILRGLSQRSTDDWILAFQESGYADEDADNRRVRYSRQATPAKSAINRRGGFEQFMTLLTRNLYVKSRDLWNTTILLIQAPVIAGLLVLVFGKHAAQTIDDAHSWNMVVSATGTSLFVMAISAIWFGCSNAAREIVGEWAIYQRERMVNLTLPAYVSSKLATLGIFCVVQCILLLAITYPGLRLDGSILYLYLTLLIASFIGMAMGLVISAIARTSEVAIALVPLTILPLLILGGALLPAHKMNAVVKLAATTMPSRWVFENMVLAEAYDKPNALSPIGPFLHTHKEKDDAEVKGIDLAEEYFPEEDERTGMIFSWVVISVMLVVMIAVIHGTLKLRDIR